MSGGDNPLFELAPIAADSKATTTPADSLVDLSDESAHENHTENTTSVVAAKDAKTPSSSPILKRSHRDEELHTLRRCVFVIFAFFAALILLICL